MHSCYTCLLSNQLKFKFTYAEWLFFATLHNKTGLRALNFRRLVADFLDSGTNALGFNQPRRIGQKD